MLYHRERGSHSSHSWETVWSFALCFFSLNLYPVSKSYYFIFWAKSLEAAMQKGTAGTVRGKQSTEREGKEEEPRKEGGKRGRRSQDRKGL